MIAKGFGGNSMRFDLEWEAVEPTPDKWSESGWARYKDMYDALIARGMRPLITVNGTPPWAREAMYQGCTRRLTCSYPPAEWALPQWTEFMGEVARRFPQAAGIEVWNEPNMSGFWRPEPNPERFARLVQAAYVGIKGINPSMRVVVGSLAPAPNTKKDILGNIQYMGLGEFLRKAYAATPSIKGYSDAISFHTVLTRLNYGAESEWANLFNAMRQAKSQFGDSAKPMWLTETGLSLHDTTAPISQAQQAAGLLEQYRRVMTMPDMAAMYVHTLGDRLAFQDPERSYGIINSFDPFNPRPAFCAFAGRVRVSIPFGSCTKIVEGPPVDDPDPPDPDPIDPPDPVDPPDPIDTAGCSFRLIYLRWAASVSTGDAQRDYRRQYRQAQKDCIPCSKRVASLKEKARRAPTHSRRKALRERLKRVKERCAPCQATLQSLEEAALDAGGPDEADALIRQHDGLRKECRGKKPPAVHDRHVSRRIR